MKYLNSLKVVIKSMVLISLFLIMAQPALAKLSSDPACKQGDPILPDLVICGKGPSACAAYQEPCTLDDAVTMIGQLILFGLTLLILVAPAYVVFIGIQMIMNKGVPENMLKLRKNLAQAMIYLVLMLAAWLIIKTIIDVFNVNPNIPQFLLNKDGTPVVPGTTQFR